MLTFPKILGSQGTIETRKMWQKLDCCEVSISDVVIEEASKGSPDQARMRLEAIRNFDVLKMEDAVRVLAEFLLQASAIPKKCPEDALHIAIAAVNSIEYIVTWNFKHIHNPFM